MFTRVYLVRHGETDNNKAHRFIGFTDKPLNDRGQAQAKCLNEPMSKLHIDRIYSSPLLRTMMTANEIRAGRDIEIIKIPGLKEINCGQWEEQNRTEIESKWPGMINLWQFEPEKLHMPDGETFFQVQTRAVEAFIDIVCKEMGHTVAIASHMLTIQLIMSYFLDIPIHDVWRMTQLENTSITTMEFYDNGTFEVKKWGEDSHLLPELKNPSVKIAGFTTNELAQFDVSKVEGIHKWNACGVLNEPFLRHCN